MTNIILNRSIIPEPQKVLDISEALEKKKFFLKPREYFGTLKYDGWWCRLSYTPSNGWQTPISGNGNKIASLSWLPEVLNSSKKGASQCIDLIMEAYHPDLEFKVLNGLLNRKYELFRDCQFALIDVIIDKRLARPAIERFMMLEDFEFLSSFKRVEFLGCSPDYDDWKTWQESTEKSGQEGIVLRASNSFYMPGKRNIDMLKMKNKIRREAVIEKITPTVGKKGRESAVLSLKRKSGLIFEVELPTEERQKEWCTNPHLYIGKVVEIEAMSEFSSGKYRQPVFYAERFDKNPSEID